VASVRHENTDYDSLLMSGVPRAAAREQIQDTIDQVLRAWGHPGTGQAKPGGVRPAS